MGTAETRPHMSRRALLTDREREVLRGDADGVENPAQYQSKIRSRLKRRLENLGEDYELLRACEPDLADRLHDEICETEEDRLDRLEREVQELEARLEEQA